MVGSNLVVGPFVHTRCRMGNLATTSHLCSSSRSHNQESWEVPSRNNNNQPEACNNHNQVLLPPRNNNNHPLHPPPQTHNLHNKPLHLRNRILHNNSPATTTKATPRYVPCKMWRELKLPIFTAAAIGSLLLPPLVLLNLI